MTAAAEENLSSLQETLSSCSQAVADGDFKRSDESISKLVEFLNSIALRVKDEEGAENTAFEVLSEIYMYLVSPSLDQDVIDALSFELPKAVAKIGSGSTRCLEKAESIIDRFIETCSPRDMVSILCEAMASPGESFNTPHYFAPLLGALAKVFGTIHRRPFEQVKASLPVVVKVLEAMFSDEDEDPDLDELLNGALKIVHSLHAICVKMEGKGENKLRPLFGLYVLEIMALISILTGAKTSRYFSMMLQLSTFVEYCGLSYIGLITGCEVDMIIKLISEGDEDGCMSCFSYIKHGAVLTVLWRKLSNEDADTTEEKLVSVEDELRNNQIKRWEAVAMLKHIFACVKLPWALKRHAIDFLFCIMEGNVSRKDCDEPLDYSIYMPGLYAALQAIQLVIIYASDPLLRRKAFDTSKRVIADFPASQRFDILMALIKNSEISSMIAILLDCVRDEMHKDYPKRISRENEAMESEKKVSYNSSFWTDGILDLVEFVLRPPKGGPPSLPEYTDAVSAALNLYRFVLITESSGKTNYTGVLSKDKLQKAYKEWLQPLRTLVSGIVAENQQSDDQLSVDTVSALNPVQFVLFRCIELVEENLKHST